MPFSPKNWVNSPDASSWPPASSGTALNATGLEDLEERVTDYADLKASLTVKEFGAIGNGTADDTSAIQDAIDAAESAGRGHVYLNAGQYKITGLLTVPDNVALIGAGKYASDLLCYDPGAGVKFDYSTSRGPLSGHFRIAMREVSTRGLWIVGNVNKTFADIRIDGMAEDGEGVRLDDCQNCYFYSLDVEATGGGGGPSGTTGLILDKGASGNRVFGLQTNECTADHIRIRMSAAAPLSGVTNCRNNTFVGLMCERGDVETSCIVRITCGEDNNFRDGNIALGVEDTPAAEYSLIVLDNEDDDASGTQVTVHNSFDNIAFNGGLGSGSSRWATAVEVKGSGTYTTISNCRSTNVKYPVKLHTISAYVNEYDNNWDVWQSGRYFGVVTGDSQEAYKRPRYTSAVPDGTNTLDTKSGFIRWIYTGTAGSAANLDVINPNAPVGQMLTLEFWDANITVRHLGGGGNIKLSGAANMTPTANDLLHLILDGVYWQEVSRVVK